MPFIVVNALDDLIALPDTRKALSDAPNERKQQRKLRSNERDHDPEIQCHGRFSSLSSLMVDSPSTSFVACFVAWPHRDWPPCHTLPYFLKAAYPLVCSFLACRPCVTSLSSTASNSSHRLNGPNQDRGDAQPGR